LLFPPVVSAEAPACAEDRRAAVHASSAARIERRTPFPMLEAKAQDAGRERCGHDSRIADRDGQAAIVSNRARHTHAATANPLEYFQRR